VPVKRSTYILKKNDNNWILQQTIEKNYTICSLKLYQNNAFIIEKNSSVIHSFIRNSGEWKEITQIIIPNTTLDHSTLTSYSTNIAISLPDFNQVHFFKIDNADAKITALVSPYNSIQPVDIIKPTDNFGYDLDMYNGILIVSAPYQLTGAVYLYIFNGLNWEFKNKTTAPGNCTSGFGEKVIKLQSYILITCKSLTQQYLNVFTLTDQLQLLQIWEYDILSTPSVNNTSILTAADSTVLLATLSGKTLSSLYLGYLYCPTGRKGISCDIDINECEESSKKCDEVCINFIGGYRCACYDGTTNCLPTVSPTTQSDGSTSLILIILGVILFLFIVGVSIFLVFIKKDVDISSKFNILPEDDEDILDDIDEQNDEQNDEL